MQRTDSRIELFGMEDNSLKDNEKNSFGDIARPPFSLLTILFQTTHHYSISLYQEDKRAYSYTQT
jgi:hypothetical protein